MKLVQELKLALKSGEYDGTDIMDAWITLELQEQQLAEANAKIERLSTIANKVRDDLLERGEVSYDGARVVNLSSTVWNKFCDVLIESPTQPLTLQDAWHLLKLHSPEYWDTKPYPDLDTARKDLSHYKSRYQAVGSNSVKEEE
jgi:hypothetical protein